MLRELVHTKIVVTHGPAVASVPALAALVSAGANVIRINSAHGSDADRVEAISSARRAEKLAGVPVGVLQDLPGPKVRVGSMPGPLELNTDDDVALVAGGTTAARTIPVIYPRLSTDLRPGHAVYIADGLIRLTVTSLRGGTIRCRVTAGGVVRTGNGVNMPNSSLVLNAFTPADQHHLRLGLDKGVDFVGISFVGNADDVRRVRAFCAKQGASPFLVAKIERRQALHNLPEIVEAADGIMVARGDLGVEVPFADIPGLQDEIVSLSHARGKPVIVATQVLESMIANPRPTRAEATDIATAILDGADAIMLSGETAVGKHPKASVEALISVIHATEARRLPPEAGLPLEGLDPSDVVAEEACRIAERIDADMIVVPTHSGNTATRVSRFRPSMPVYAMVNEDRLRRRLSLYWGVRTLPTRGAIEYATLAADVRERLLKAGKAKRGQTAVMVSGAPGVLKGQTGMVQVVTI